MAISEYEQQVGAPVAVPFVHLVFIEQRVVIINCKINM